MPYTNEQRQWLADMQKRREMEKLQRLQQKYSVTPDYSTMSLQDELQARFDIDEMKQLQAKYGATQQTPVHSMPTSTPIPPTVYTPIRFLQSMIESTELSRNNMMPQNNTVLPASNTDLINRMYEHIKVNEGFKDFPYYDTKWNPTVGAGVNVSNHSRFNSMDWRDINNPARKATQEEIDACWNNLQQEKERLQSESSTPQRNNYLAGHFKQFCDIRVLEDDMKKVYEDHMLKDLPSIRRKLPNFDRLDPRVQNVVMDRMYNMGAPNFAGQKDFLQHAADNNLQGLLQEVETSPIASGRKEWVRRHLK